MNQSKLPEGWVSTNFGDANYFQILGSGVKYFTGKKEYLSTSSVNNDKIVNVEEIITHKNRPSRANMQPIPNSVWYAKMKATVKVLKADKKIIQNNVLSTGFCGVLCKNIEPEFVKQVFLTEIFNIKKDIRTEGSTQEAINNNEFKKLEIVFPKSIEEQQKIAHILLTIDNTIDKTKELIEKNKKIKQGLMHDTFSAFEIQEIMTVEEMLKKGLLQEIQDGNHGELHPKTKDFVSVGVPFLMANDINNGKIDFEHCHRITELQYSSLRIGFAQSGDVLLTHKGTVGRTCIVPDNCGKLMLTPQVTYYRIKDSKKLNPSFLYHFFNTDEFQKQILAVSAQSTRNYIGIVAQRKLKIKISKSEEYQKRVGKILDLTCSKIESEELYLEKLLKIKAGLMQDLLTGKVRVAA